MVLIGVCLSSMVTAVTWLAFDADADQACSFLEGALHGVEALVVAVAVCFGPGDGPVSMVSTVPVILIRAA
jgi:hypothetical protein